jgi:ubiquitin C-terminal hydrolase
MQAVIPYTIGFHNLTNTCYANSILSCLMQTREFNTYFGAHGIKNLPKNNLTTFIRDLNGLISASFKNNCIISRNFNKILMETLHERKMFTFKLQHDAQEFLVQIISSLERELSCLIRQPNILNQAL